MMAKVVEGVEWIKILENIMTIVSPEKLESSTNGEWRAVICRCLSMLLDNSKTCMLFFAPSFEILA